uniref:histidine kinase n=1 Tax=Thermosporothrix sp. COM3 TaxID=2490863 RepID=A0A455SCB3_9CHLR|nr:hypothetical protein KTC_08540 [Thermosporothrix sp. COM3]
MRAQNVRKKIAGQLFHVGLLRAALEMIIFQVLFVVCWTFLFHDSSKVNMDEASISFFIFFSPSSILVFSLRWRLQYGNMRLLKRLLYECGIACLLFFFFCGVVALLFYVPIVEQTLLPLSQSAESYQSEARSVMLFLGIANAICCAAFFLFLRVASRALIYWNRLRRQHLSWSLTHAILMVPLSCLFFVFLLVGFVSIWSSAETQLPSAQAPLAIVLILLMFFFLSMMVIVFLLPVAAIFSHFFVSKTTERLELLVAAAGILRSGDYRIRVPVQGEDEVARLQADFNAMAAALDQTMHELQNERDNVARLLNERRELIANVSHELRTPVATIRGYLESSLNAWQQEPPATLKQDLETIEMQTIRLQTLIDDLFTLSRMEVGKLALRCEPINIELLVQRVVDTVKPIAWRGRRIELIGEVRPHLPYALVDESRVEQIIQNLLNNAMRHTSPGGIIAVTAEPHRDQIMIQVKDTGEGIDPRELKHIWDRFYRTEKSRQKPASGTGLGLAIVKDLTEAMGGTVSVESRLGEGTCFTILLPKAGRNTSILDTAPLISIPTSSRGQ